MLRDISWAIHFERSDRISMFVETTNTGIYKQERTALIHKKTNIDNDVLSVSNVIYKKLIFGGGLFPNEIFWQEYRLFQYA